MALLPAQGGFPDLRVLLHSQPVIVITQPPVLRQNTPAQQNTVIPYRKVTQLLQLLSEAVLIIAVLDDYGSTEQSGCRKQRPPDSCRLLHVQNQYREQQQRADRHKRIVFYNDKGFQILPDHTICTRFLRIRRNTLQRNRTHRHCRSLLPYRHRHSGNATVRRNSR